MYVSLYFDQDFFHTVQPTDWFEIENLPLLYKMKRWLLFGTYRSTNITLLFSFLSPFSLSSSLLFYILIFFRVYLHCLYVGKRANIYLAFYYYWFSRITVEDRVIFLEESDGERMCLLGYPGNCLTSHLTLMKIGILYFPKILKS